MSRLSGFRIPPLSAAVNVAMQTLRQTIPDKNKGNAAAPEQPTERVRFAQLNSGGSQEHCEMSNMTPPAGNQSLSNLNPWSPDKSDQAEDSFNQGYQTGPVAKQPSLTSVDFGSEDDFQEGMSNVQINEYQAAWNVTNAIQGMFIVSLPFAVLRGGYWAIAAMIGIAYICCYTGKILVECLYEFDPVQGKQVRVRDSYVSIAKECFGKKYGARAVNIAQIIELLMTCILYVVVCGDLMIGTFPNGAIDTRSWMMLIGLLLLPLGKLYQLLLPNFNTKQKCNFF